MSYQQKIFKIATAILQNPQDSRGENKNEHANRQIKTINTRVSINAGRRDKEQKKLKENGEISRRK